MFILVKGLEDSKVVPAHEKLSIWSGVWRQEPGKSHQISVP